MFISPLCIQILYESRNKIALYRWTGDGLAIFTGIVQFVVVRILYVYDCMFFLLKNMKLCCDLISLACGWNHNSCCGWHVQEAPSVLPMHILGVVVVTMATCFHCTSLWLVKHPVCRLWDTVILHYRQRLTTLLNSWHVVCYVKEMYLTVVLFFSVCVKCTCWNIMLKACILIL